MFPLNVAIEFQNVMSFKFLWQDRLAKCQITGILQTEDREVQHFTFFHTDLSHLVQLSSQASLTSVYSLHVSGCSVVAVGVKACSI